MAVASVLRGTRVRLRPPTMADADALFQNVARDPEVTRYLSWAPHTCVTETRRVIAEIYSTERTWLIEREGDVAGVCGWRQPQPHAVDLGYCLGSRWWRQGVISEVVALLLAEAQADPRIYRVSAFCHPANAGSASVLRRNRFALEGRLARYAVFPSISPEPQDALLFARAVR